MVTSHLPIPRDPNSNEGLAQKQFTLIANISQLRQPDRIAMLNACNEVEQRVEVIRKLLGAQ